MKQTFTARIEAARGGGAFVTIPFDVEATFGAKRVPVQATFDGVPYRGMLVRMGGPAHVLGILKEIRTGIGKGIGDEVEVTVERDTEPRVVDVPVDLRAALTGDDRARATFEALSFSHQREYVRWIEEAKRAETRATRIARTVELLREGKAYR